MNGTTTNRAQSAEGLVAMLGALATGPTTHFRPYAPRPGDVIVASWAKSGTTMMQQMFHQLRSRGDMDFDDISRVVPWDDMAATIDFDMEQDQPFAPRGFKSHREYERLPAGLRYVVTVRDPKETYASFYRFWNGWLIEPGAIPIEGFFPFWMGGGPGGCDYATHLLSWYARRDAPDTMLASYRWVLANKRAAIRRLAALCEIALDDGLADIVERNTSRDFMVRHQDKFDDALVCAAMARRMGLPRDGQSAKVHAEGSDAKALPRAVVDAIDEMWATKIAPVTGNADFPALAAEIDRDG